ncbi:NHL repeat-containing protein, partial [Singulisphaera rosea]
SGVLQGLPIQVDQIANTAATVPSYPAVAMNASGAFDVVWVDPSNNGVVDARRFNSSGTALAGVFQVSSSSTRVDQETRPADVAIDVNGNFVVTWSALPTLTATSHNIYMSLFNSSGTLISSALVNSDVNFDDIQPAVAMDNSGNFEIIWESISQDVDPSPYGSSPGVYGQRYHF